MGAARGRSTRVSSGRGSADAARGPPLARRGVAAGAVAVTLAVVMLVGGGPGIEDVASAATRPPTAKVAVVPADSKVLKERVADVRFPNYFGKFGWKAVGTRTDEIGGRATRTVFYEKDGKRDRLHRRLRRRARGARRGRPGHRRGHRDRARCGPRGREVVTWRRRGHTCVLSSKDVPRCAELLALAGWKGKGSVAF